MRIRVRLPGGTFKIKTWADLRSHEIARRVPVLRLGELYFIWDRPLAPPARRPVPDRESARS